MSFFFGNGDIRSSLNTQIIGQRVYFHDLVESTNDVARALADDGHPEGTVVVARGQTKGRGRLGRTWVSPANGGIYASVILRPPKRMDKMPLLTLTAALAVARAMEDFSVRGVVIKWPNDVYLDGRKLGGILIELYHDAKAQTVVIVGIGINVNASQTELPPQAIALAEKLRVEIDTADLLHILLRRMDEQYVRFLGEDFGGILNDIRTVSMIRLGQRLRIDQEGSVVEGYAQDLDETGAMVLRLDSGILKLVTSGQVVFL